MRDVKEKKCGCIIFQIGPPVLCDTHQAKATKREARQQRQEERGLRKLVADAARDHGHDLSTFREYNSQPGKWTAHCHSCGALAIVYDAVPLRGDQVNAARFFEACRGGSSTLTALAGHDKAVAGTTQDAGGASEL